MQAWQIIALTVYAMFVMWEELGPQFFLAKPVVAGMMAGLIMGDMNTGLFIGGTLQLMVLGVGTYGGSSIPDYMSGALIGTAFAVTSMRGGMDAAGAQPLA